MTFNDPSFTIVTDIIQVKIKTFSVVMIATLPDILFYCQLGVLRPYLYYTGQL